MNDYIIGIIVTLFLLVATSEADSFNMVITCKENNKIRCDLQCIPVSELSGVSCNWKKKYRCFKKCQDRKHHLGCLKACEFDNQCDRAWLDVLMYNQPNMECKDVKYSPS